MAQGRLADAFGYSQTINLKEEIHIQMTSLSSIGPDAALDHRTPPDSTPEPDEPKWGHWEPEHELDMLADEWERKSKHSRWEDVSRGCFAKCAAELRALMDAQWPSDGSEPPWKREKARIKAHASHVAETIQDGIRTFVEGGAE